MMSCRLVLINKYWCASNEAKICEPAYICALWGVIWVLRIGIDENKPKSKSKSKSV